MTEKTVVTLDASQMDVFGACETKWGFLYKENLRPVYWDKTGTEKMDLGTLFHELLLRYYRIRALTPGTNYMLDGDKALEDFFKSGKIQELGFDLQETGSFIRRRWADYIMKYPSNIDFIPIVANGKPGVEVGFTKKLFEDETRIYLVEGKLDILSITQHKQPIFWDHKSQEQARTFFDYTIQFLTYSWATGYRYGGINYIGTQKEVNKNSFRRQMIFFPEEMIDEWEAKMLTYFHKVYSHMRLGVKLDKNLSICGGNFKYYPCIFSRICWNPPEKQELIKWFWYAKKAPWTPWTEDIEEFE